jgi:hypothetical protein
MTRFGPVRSTVLDSLLEHRLTALPPAETPPLLGDDAQPGSTSLPWTRIVLVAVPALGVALLSHFPPWAILVLPVSALAAQVVRRRRWPYRLAAAAVFAAYAAQLIRIALFPWAFRFAAAVVLFAAAAFFWGLLLDEFDG